jgi:hypothetical protein
VTAVGVLDVVPTWEVWERDFPQEVRLIPGAKPFIEAAEQMGVTVIYISNRVTKHQASTIAALKNVGLNTEDIANRILLKEQTSVGTGMFVALGLLGVAAAAGILALSAIPMMLASANYDRECRFLTWPARVHQLTFAAGILILGISLGSSSPKPPDNKLAARTTYINQSVADSVSAFTEAAPCKCGSSCRRRR